MEKKNELEFSYPKVGVTVKYNTPYVYEDKYKIKINGCPKGETVEGIWALIHPDDYEDYVSDKRDTEYKRVALLLNHSIYGIEWGSPILYRLTGPERPGSVYDNFIDKPDDLHDVLTNMSIIKD